MCSDIVVVAIQLLVEEVDRVLPLQTKTGYVLQRIQCKVEAAHFVQNHHVEWRGGRTAVHVPVHMEAAFIGAPVNKSMNEPAIVVEGEDHWRRLSKERIERHFVHTRS